MMAAAVRVLYVDDEPDLLDVAKIFLEESGDFSIVTIESAPAALELLKTKQFDAIISDYQMPGMDGIQFLVEVRARFGLIPFILFTGRGREEVVIQAINSGADFYLQKGGEPGAQFAELSNKIRYAVSRKNADDSLRQSEQKYQHLIEHSDEAIVVAQDGMLRRVNHRAVELTGYSEQELLSMSFSAFIHPDDRALVMGRFQKRLKGEELPPRYAFRLSPKDASTRWVEISAVAIDWIGLPATLNFLTDITERKRVEEALKSSQIQLFEAMDLAHIVNWEFDVATGIFTFDDRFYALYGTTAEIEGGNQMPADVYARKFVHPDDQCVVADEVNKAIQAIDPGYVSQVEHRIIRRDGEIRHIIVRFGILKDENGRTIRTHGANQDITDRKRVEEALVESTSFNRDLVENLPDYIGVSGPDGKILYMNLPAANALGYTVEELIGTSVLSYVADEYRDDVISRMVTRHEGNVIPPYEIDVLSRDGRRISVIVKGTPLLYRNTPAHLLVLTDITDRKRVEEALLFTRHSIDSATDTMVTVAKDGHFVDVNDSFCRQSGYTRDELLSMTVHDLDPDYNMEIWSAFWNKLKQSGSLTIETTHRTKEGRTYPVEITLTYFEYNGCEYHCGFARDITERKRVEEALRKKAEELYAANEQMTASEEELRQTMEDLTRQELALRESETRYREFFTTSRDSVFITSPDGRLIDFNNATLEMLGYDNREEMSKVSISSHYAHPEERPAFLNLIERDGYVKEYPMRLRQKDGTVIDTLITTVPERNPDGSLKAFIGTIRDVTGRKKAEDALHESEQKFHTMADFTVDWEYWLAPDGSFVYISPSCEAITAYSPGEFIADPSLLAKIVYPDDTPLYSDHISRVHSFADWGNLDFRIVKRDGEIRWVSHTCMPVNGEDGTYLGQRASNRDITGRKQAEEAQLKNAEELRAANEQMTASEEELRQNLDDLGRSERALRESENSFRTIIHSMLFGIVIIDAKTHTILEANQKALDMIGGNWDIVSGSVCHRFICPAECGRCPVTDLGQTVDSSERFLLTMSGEKIPIFKTVVKTTLAGREVLIESFIDITGRDTGEPGKGARFEMTVPKGAWRNAGNGA